MGILCPLIKIYLPFIWKFGAKISLVARSVLSFLIAKRINHGCIKKGLFVCGKRMNVFYTLMDKPTRTLVSARCKGVNERLGPEFLIWAKAWKLKETKSSDILKFRKWSKILWKPFTKKLLLRKCQVRFILHFVLAVEG